MYQYTSQNLQHHLIVRESNLPYGRRHPVPNHFLFHEKNFYKSITPRLSVLNVDKPHGFLRKFSPDGELLLSTSQDLKSLDVYQYQGVGSVAHLLSQERGECITAADHSLLSLHIRQKLFGNLFQLKFNIPLITPPTNSRNVVHREFNIFLDEGRYVLLASQAGGSIFPNYLAFHQYSDLYDNTELYDYTFYLVDLKKGRIADTLKIEHDFVVLSHNHSVSLYGRTLAILSTYRQCIELIELNATDGKLQPLFTIGPYGSDLDHDRILAHEQRTNFDLDPGSPLPLSHLKQKILAFMYREALDAKTVREKQQKLKEFYKNFEEVERMIILKMQLIDSDNLLLRYEKRRTLLPVETRIITQSNTNQGNTNFKLYVFYNITEQKVLKICPMDSVEILQMLRNYSHLFRNVRSLQIPWHSSSPSDNDAFRHAFDTAVYSCDGGIQEAIARFNPTLPISTQSFSTSPYLDNSVFDYDDCFISPLERPRLNCMVPLLFCDRLTGVSKFRVFLEEPNDLRCDDYESTRNSRDLVTYIFHPYEPFFISIQKFPPRFVINFHLYNTSTVIHTDADTSSSTL